MFKKFFSLFTDHPASVNETYLQHLGFAFCFGGRLFLAGICCMIHGIFPFLFEKTGTNAIRKLVKKMDDCGRGKV